MLPKRLARDIKEDYILSSWATLNSVSGATLNSHTLSMETHWIMSITGLSQDVCVLYWSLKVSVPQPQIFWNVPTTTFDLLFSPKRQFSNEKIWCLETKLWLKVIFSQYAETSVWFLHVVTDCYYSGRRNSNKFFLTTNFPFVQSRFSHSEKRSCSGLSL